MKKQNIEEFNQKLYDVYGDEYKLVGEYVNSHTKHEFYHKTCGCCSMIYPSLLLQKKDKCNCLKRKLIDISGNKYGRLLVLYESERHKANKSKRIFHCRCDCGNELDVSYSNLVNQHTRSCGCYMHDVTRKNHIVDLTGQHIGMLTILEQTYDKIDSKNRHYIQYKCLCDCGKTIIKQASYIRSVLKYGGIPSCGCYTKQIRGKWKLLDLTNMRFGKLVAQKRAENRYYQNSQSTVWECLCDCGNTVYVTTSNLRTNKVTSCGCTHVISNGEKCISEILDKHKENYNFLYIPQYRFKDCRNKKPLPFDFSLFVDDKIVGLIEYDGEGHYLEKFYTNNGIKNPKEKLKEVKYKDAIKTSYCERNNIPLLRIPYWYKDNLENIVTDFLNTLLK